MPDIGHNNSSDFSLVKNEKRVSQIESPPLAQYLDSVEAHVFFFSRFVGALLGDHGN